MSRCDNCALYREGLHTIEGVVHTVYILQSAHWKHFCCCCYALLAFFQHRSPQLGCLYGALATLRSLQLTYTLLFQDYSDEGLFKMTGLSAVFELLGSPATAVGVGALLGLVVRLLVLYEPSKMRKWKPFVKEKTLARALCWAYVVLEAAMWTLVSVYGLDRCERQPTICLDISYLCRRMEIDIFLQKPLAA